MILIDGKKVAAELREELKKEVIDCWYQLVLITPIYWKI